MACLGVPGAERCWGAGPKVRATGYLYQDSEEALFRRPDELLEIDKNCSENKRKVIQRHMDAGLSLMPGAI